MPKLGDKKPIDWDKVYKLMALHCTQEEIAGMMDIDIATLDYRIKHELDTTYTELFSKKSAEGKMSVRRRQYVAAMEGNPTMLVWIGKQWLKQVDKQEISTNQPINIQIHADEK